VGIVSFKKRIKLRKRPNLVANLSEGPLRWRFALSLAKLYLKQAIGRVRG
jgi:hypothetical protein